MRGSLQANQRAVMIWASADRCELVMADLHELLPSRAVAAAEIPDSAECLVYNPSAQPALESGCVGEAFDIQSVASDRPDRGAAAHRAPRAPPPQ